MPEVLLFHHALGLTDGVLRLADGVREAGHVVHTPDLYDGRRFSTTDEGVAHARAVGFDEVVARGVHAAAQLPDALVYAGISLGVMPAQQLAQTRPGALAALLLEACVPPTELGSAWPDAVPVQVHGMQDDPSFAGEGDLDAARALVQSVPRGELFLYPGGSHLFCDSSLPWYDAGATALLVRRVLDLLAHV